MIEYVCVILAAGRATRFGSDKTAAVVGDATMADKVLELCAGRPALAVVSKQNEHRFAEITTIRNHAPERGMAHSMRLADAFVPRSTAFVVLLADMPFVAKPLIGKLVSALERGAEVAYPENGERPGHPVAFSASARTYIRTLPDGDGLHRLRDHTNLTRRSIRHAHFGSYTDVDTPSDLHELTAVFGGAPPLR